MTIKCNTRPVGLVMELHPTIHEAGDDALLRRVTLTCKYRAPEPLTIKFYHDGQEQAPAKYYNDSRLHKDGWHGVHKWHTVWDTRRQGDIYECHTITEKGFTLGVLTTSLPEPGSRVRSPCVYDVRHRHASNVTSWASFVKRGQLCHPARSITMFASP